VFLVNSRLTPFTAALFSSRREVLHLGEHPFFRSYGAILPSSFCKTHSSTLGYSPRLPVSVCGTDDPQTRVEVFLGSMIRTSL